MILSRETLCLALALSAAPFGPALAQSAENISDEAAFAANTLVLLFAGMGALLFIAGIGAAAAAFARAKNPALIGVRAIAVLAAASAMTWLSGYNLIDSIEEGGLLGRFSIWTASEASTEDFAPSSDWFFQVSIAGVAAALATGALGDRVKFWPAFIFAAVMAGLIYPIGAAWAWSGGYLDSDWAFSDFAGSTVIYAAAGWAALAGALAVGVRRNRNEYSSTPAPAAVLATPAILLLWVGWLGFSSGFQPSVFSAGGAAAQADVIANANMAATGGVISAMALTALVYKRIDAAMVFNGVLGGLVSISAEPVAPAIWQAILIGAFGGAIVAIAPQILERLRIDDAAGVISACLLCGLWGTLIVPWSNPDASLLAQAVGALMIGALAFVLSLLTWFALKYSVGIRANVEPDPI